ncbi:hypothetical protein [Nocardia sp. NPDC005978]|uniref:hypothetical protein n=1 Tax=unclassified Nocardia TaxID=2637762 RepID=UPI0033B57C3B
MTHDNEAPAHIEVGYTHLFAGLELRPDRPAADYELLFSDGSVVRAEVLGGAAGESVLRVDSYRTEAGTVIPERVWMVRPGAGDAVKLGRAL